jgi:hypothetical protein
MNRTIPEESRNLKTGMKYACISYQVKLYLGLNNVEKMANKPIRRTLNQYLCPIKSLTNLSNNNKMKRK